MKEKLQLFFLSALISGLIFSSTAPPVSAAGDTNMDGGGGSMNSGTSSNKWSSGDDGVRVTVVAASDGLPLTTPIDITNRWPSYDMLHFGKVCKSSYLAGTSLSIRHGSYSYIHPTEPLPTIINASGTTNIQAVKAYFTDEQVIRSIANIVGMNYDILIGGDYKLLVEPLAFFTFGGNVYAATATEVAKYDLQLSGGVRSKLVSFSNKNLPLSIYLEYADLGYSAWTGSTSSAIASSYIVTSLGIGIVRFEDIPEVPEMDTIDYIYRTNTEVITAVTIRGGQSDPDNPTTVTFSIDGRNFDVGNVYYPDGYSQLAWMKWTTPADPQIMTIPVTVTGPGGTSNGSIRCEIVDLDANPPPNPVADDRNDSFSATRVPTRDVATSTNWVTWTPWWQEFWVDMGYWGSEGNWVTRWVDKGWWEFDCNYFYASLSGSMDLTPDSLSPTASGTSLKSGYGYQQTVTSRTSTNGSSAVSQTPSGVTYFPEFLYETYWRLLERMATGLNSRLEFQENQYSTYENRTHFTPIWYPDGNYTANTWLIDVWTPTGMLSLNLTDSLNISGNLWDDWHIGPQ